MLKVKFFNPSGNIAFSFMRIDKATPIYTLSDDDMKEFIDYTKKFLLQKIKDEEVIKYPVVDEFLKVVKENLFMCM